MSKLTELSKKVELGLYKAAGLASRVSYPASWETLDIDENESVWASYMPEYEARPPLFGETTADLAIIGGGYTGISTAYHFSRRFPNKRVVILEAKKLANGASGRNGGMVLNWVYGMGDMSDETTAAVYSATKRTIDSIDGIINEHKLDVSYRLDGCLEVFTDEQRAAAAEAEVAHLNSIGVPVQFLDAGQVREKLGLQGVHGALFDASEGQLNGVQFIRELRPILEESGVEIYENTRVTKVEEGYTIKVSTNGGLVKARAIVLATNGYTGKLGYFRKAYFPLHSHVFATDTLSDEKLDQLGWHQTAGFSDDLNRISYATRTKEGHVVFGGGSNISYGYKFNNGTAWSGSAESKQPAFDDMHRTLNGYMPGFGMLPRKYEWTGTLAISLRRNCSMGVRGDFKNVYYALGYSGHGVVAANMAGRVLTDIYSDAEDEWRHMPFVNAPFSSIPLEPFRTVGYQMMTKLTGKSPREPHR